MTSQLPRFRGGFFAAGSWEKDTKNGAAVTSLRSFLFRDDFSIWVEMIIGENLINLFIVVRPLKSCFFARWIWNKSNLFSRNSLCNRWKPFWNCLQFKYIQCLFWPKKDKNTITEFTLYYLIWLRLYFSRCETFLIIWFVYQLLKYNGLPSILLPGNNI